MNVQVGHNNPPDPIDEATAPFADAIEEAESWLDGSPVENEGQLKAVDALIKDVKAAKKSVADAEKSATAPLYDTWKAEKARWKPTLDDIDRIAKGLVACASGFRKKLAAEKEAERRAAFEEAERKRIEAERAAATASEADIEAQREAAIKAELAREATEAARNSEKVKGLRKVWKYEITDEKAALHWIARNDKQSMSEFISEYVRRKHKTAIIDGVNAWQEKEAF